MGWVGVGWGWGRVGHMIRTHGKARVGKGQGRVGWVGLVHMIRALGKGRVGWCRVG